MSLNMIRSLGNFSSISVKFAKPHGLPAYWHGCPICARIVRRSHGGLGWGYIVHVGGQIVSERERDSRRERRESLGQGRQARRRRTTCSIRASARNQGLSVFCCYTAPKESQSVGPKSSSAVSRDGAKVKRRTHRGWWSRGGGRCLPAQGRPSRTTPAPACRSRMCSPRRGTRRRCRSAGPCRVLGVGFWCDHESERT